jgi:aspartyl/asparaginyl beta-hydroxylase (cupin superfamily)
MSAASSDTRRSLADLIARADRAAAQGNPQEAGTLLEEARALSPTDSGVLAALGLYGLKTGNFAAARRHFEDAVCREPSALAWFHVALACRAQVDPEAEGTAIERALQLDPRFPLALLQKATLFERQGLTKQAAEVFQAFLHCLPAGAQQPAGLKPAIEHAQRMVEADRRVLEQFIRARTTTPGERAQLCLEALVGRRRIFHPQPTVMHFPRLPAIEFFDRLEFPWLDAFEAATEEIRAELETVLGDRDSDQEIKPYVDYPDSLPLDQWRSLNRSTRWGAYYLVRNGSPVEKHLGRCPKTAALLANASLADIPGEAPNVFFSILQPRTRIPPHTGVSNTRLVVHVPLIVPPNCGFRVGSETRAWQSGHAWVFDDTIEHEAWNDSDAPRVILLFDTWNPFLTAAERDWVRAATVAVSEYRAG